MKFLKKRAQAIELANSEWQKTIENITASVAKEEVTALASDEEQQEYRVENIRAKLKALPTTKYT